VKIGKVTGSVWATKKDEQLSGKKLLIVEMTADENHGISSECIVAVDYLGAGSGDLVLVSTGSSARFALDEKEIPVDASVVGIIDKVEVDENGYE